MYTDWDGAEPVVDFQKFIDDNESSVDVVSSLLFLRVVPEKKNMGETAIHIAI